MCFCLLIFFWTITHHLASSKYLSTTSSSNIWISDSDTYLLLNHKINGNHLAFLELTNFFYLLCYKTGPLCTEYQAFMPAGDFSLAFEEVPTNALYFLKWLHCNDYNLLAKYCWHIHDSWTSTPIKKKFNEIVLPYSFLKNKKYNC